MPFHYLALEANYDVFWQRDGDAYLWHHALGDIRTDCKGPWGQMAEIGEYLTIEIRK